MGNVRCKFGNCFKNVKNVAVRYISYYNCKFGANLDKSYR